MLNKIKQMLEMPSAWRAGESKTNCQCFYCGERYNRLGGAGNIETNGHRYSLMGGCSCGNIPALVLHDAKMQAFEEDYQRKMTEKIKQKPKVSKWVDDINNMPFEFYGRIIDSPDILPSWDITFKYFDGRTETKRIKYKKRDGYSNYRQMQTIYKCILKNWRER